MVHVTERFLPERWYVPEGEVGQSQNFTTFCSLVSLYRSVKNRKSKASKVLLCLQCARILSRLRFRFGSIQKAKWVEASG